MSERASVYWDDYAEKLKGNDASLKQEIFFTEQTISNGRIALGFGLAGIVAGVSVNNFLKLGEKESFIGKAKNSVGKTLTATGIGLTIVGIGFELLADKTMGLIEHERARNSIGLGSRN